MCTHFCCNRGSSVWFGWTAGRCGSSRRTGTGLDEDTGIELAEDMGWLMLLRTHVAGKLELRCSKRWLSAHADLVPVDTWRIVAFSLLLAEKRGFRLVFRHSSHFSISRFLIQTEMTFSTKF